MLLFVTKHYQKQLKSIMIVDDEADNRTTIKTILDRKYIEKELKNIVDLYSGIKPWKYHDLDSKCRSWCVGQAGLGRIQRRNISRGKREGLCLYLFRTKTLHARSK